jgi:hypothetical protein
MDHSNTSILAQIPKISQQVTCLLFMGTMEKKLLKSLQMQNTKLESFDNSIINDIPLQLPTWAVEVIYLYNKTNIKTFRNRQSTNILKAGETMP